MNMLFQKLSLYLKKLADLTIGRCCCCCGCWNSAECGDNCA